MEIQDIGLPGWTLQLPSGMILKMGSAQGVLIIPDDEEPELPFPTQEQLATAIGDARKMLAEQAAMDELAAAADRDPGIIDADDLPPGHYDR